MSETEHIFFQRALPIWIAGRRQEMNTLFTFRAILACGGEPVQLRVTASSIYRLRVNGAFVGHGPVRAAHGYFRIDEWDLDGHLTTGDNAFELEVAGYNINSFYTLNQPPFVQCEIVADGEVKRASGCGDDFIALDLQTVIHRVQRFSFQRPFIECYRLPPRQAKRVEVEPVPAVRLLPRRLPYPHFDKVNARRIVGIGSVTPAPDQRIKRDRSLLNIGPQLAGYRLDELEICPTDDLQRLRSVMVERNEPMRESQWLEVAPDKTFVLDLGCNLSGFIGCTLRCRTATKLVVMWDEVLQNSDVPCQRIDAANLIHLECQTGKYTFESLQPYTMRFIKVLTLQGACEISGIYLREFCSPAAGALRCTTDDARLRSVFDAAVQTYQQNAADLLMDCPSRERAGWLCDSFFTARTAHLLSGTTADERCFLENYLLAPALPQLPAGMLPMCYPADHDDGVFIPQWPLWLVLELKEYLGRSGDRRMIDEFRTKIERQFKFFTPYENEDGLLEDVAGWNFIEWSGANDFVQGVHYPTNMLYAASLRVGAELYGREDWRSKAERIRTAVLRQSFDGEYFVDNAIRRDGELRVTRNRSEVCQYFAFFFGLVSPQSHPALWERLRGQFGPMRKQEGLLPDIQYANAFIGMFLRLELLSLHGLHEQLLDELIQYFLPMAQRTGTLWENDSDIASCNHGFASHVVVWFVRAGVAAQEAVRS